MSLFLPQLNTFNSIEEWARALTASLENVEDVFVVGLTADKVTAGTIDAAVITVLNLDADNINSGSISTDRLTIDGVTIENNGGTLEIGTADWTTHVGGANKPEDNATVGATLGPGGDVAKVYAADANSMSIIVTDTDADVFSTGSGTYTTLRTFTPNGSGSVRIKCDVQDPPGTGDPHIRLRQNGLTLVEDTGVAASSSWLPDEFDEVVTLNSSTLPVTLEARENSSPGTVTIRAFQVLETSANGETLT